MKTPLAAAPLRAAVWAMTLLVLASTAAPRVAHAQNAAAQFNRIADDILGLNGEGAEEAEDAAVLAALRKLQADHLVDQYRPMLEAELAFVQRICRTDEEQQEKITADVTRTVREACERVAVVNFQANGVRARRGFRVHVDDPRESLQQAMSASLKAHLRPEQLADYEREAHKRREFRKRAVIDSVISEFDAAVLLSPTQRERIREALSANWQENWYPAGNPLVLHHRHRSFGVVDMSLVISLLTPQQYSAWESLTGGRVQAWGRGGPVQVWPGGGNRLILIDGVEEADFRAQQVFDVEVLQGVQEGLPIIEALPALEVPAEAQEVPLPE
jgi:hypothetical protein